MNAVTPSKANFEFQIEEDAFIAITPWRRSKKLEVEPKQVSGPRWMASGELKEPEDPTPTLSLSPAIAPARMDADDDDEEAEDEAMDADASHAAKRGPERMSPDAKRGKSNEGVKVSKPKADAFTEVPVKDGVSGPQGFGRILDLAGHGNCGWRSMAWMIGSRQDPKDGKPFDRASLLANIEKIAECLRVKAISFLLRRCADWKRDWIPVPGWDSTTEDYRPVLRRGDPQAQPLDG